MSLNRLIVGAAVIADHWRCFGNINAEVGAGAGDQVASAIGDGFVVTLKLDIARVSVANFGKCKDVGFLCYKSQRRLNSAIVFFND